MARGLIFATLALLFSLSNAQAQNWQQGFNFRNTANYVSDPSSSTYVLPDTAYPTMRNGLTFGWANTALVQARDRSLMVDPRLAGMNFVSNGAPAKFYVDLPSAGTYNLSLAMGDDGYPQCWTQCQVQFLDGSTVVGTVTGRLEGLGYFYDATGKNWSATAWPGTNLTLPVTMKGTRLTVVVGTNSNTGDFTPIAFLGVTQTMVVPSFTVTANPSAVSVAQGSQGSFTISSTISEGFNSTINLSATGMPMGTTVSFNPNPIAAPGAGSSTMTITVGGNTPIGSYPITVTGDGGGLERTTTVTLTVTVMVKSDFTIAAMPNRLVIGRGNQGTSTVTTTIMGGFNSPISLSATGMPTGTTMSFNPNPIAAPGNGSSRTTVMVGGSTALGTYPITVTGTGGGTQHSVTVMLTVTTAVWQQGFDFRATANYLTDPPTSTYVLSTTAYPTVVNGVTFGWAHTALGQARDRSQMVDARLAGINFVSNGTPATFYVDLPSAGTYNLTLAMGDDGYPECLTQCQIQFLDGNRVVATLAEGQVSPGDFYDANGNLWSAAEWPSSNTSVRVTMTGTQLTALVGTSVNTGDSTPIAYLGVQQVSTAPTFAVDAPDTISVGQGEYGTIDVSTLLIGAFNSTISLSASGAPNGAIITFNPATIPAPGAGTSVVTFKLAANTPLGTYPITVTAIGGGVTQMTTAMLTVTVPTSPDFSLNVPSAIAVARGKQGSTTIETTITGSFKSAISLSASGVPTGTTVRFNPASIPAPGAASSTMTVTVSPTTRLRSYPLQINGNGGHANHSATITLTISASGMVNLPAGTGWLQLGTSTVFCNENPGNTYFNFSVGAVDAELFLSLCEEGSMIGYGGGAADTANDRYFLWTSGHNNYQGNEMYELDLRGAEPTVSRITDPAWTVDNTDVPPDCACRGTYNCGQGMWHDGKGQLVSTPYSESGFGGPTFESIPAPDGSRGQPSCGYGSRFKPNSRETYAGLIYDPGRRKLFNWGGVPAADPTSTGMLSNWSLDLTQDPPKWTRLRDSAYVWFTAAVYDYTTGHPTSGNDLVYDENQTLYAYSAATDTYTVLSNRLRYIGYNVNLELDPIHHTLVLENGDSYGGYHLEIINLDSCNGTTCSITNLDQRTSCQPGMGYWAGMAWDTKRQVMALFPSSSNCSGGACIGPFNTAYLLNADANNPVTITYKGTQRTIQPLQCFAASYGSQQGVDYPPESVGPGVYSRFKYYPNEDVYLFIQHPDRGVWILRLE